MSQLSRYRSRSPILPGTLGTTYERILLLIGDVDREHALRVLELPAFAKRPMRAEEVAEAVDVDDRFLHPKDVLEICAN